MLRSGKTLLKKTVVSAVIDLTPLQNAICVHQTRGLRPRKPLYSGMAKSKLFKVPKRTEVPPDEMAEIRRISNQYRLYMRSISHYFKLENQSHAAGSVQADMGLEMEEEEWQESLTRIKQWNDEVALKRIDRLSEERKVKEDKIRETILEEERNQRQQLEEINRIICMEKEKSATYITPENIDKAIEQALEDKLDYNYAVDTRGNKVVGRFVTASGQEELPQEADPDEDMLPSLFQSSPISSQSASGK